MIEPRFKPPAEEPKRRAWNSTLPAASAPMNQVSARRASESPADRGWSDRVRDRASGRCEMPVHVADCNRVGTDPHHVRPKSLAPSLRHDPGNGIWVSRACHDWIGRHPLEAMALGVLDLRK